MSRSLLASSFLLSTAFIPHALADSNESAGDLPSYERADIERLVVTGRYRPLETASGTKTLTPLVDVPQTISVLTAQQIADQAIFDLGDISRVTPGVSTGQGEGHRDQITIRGQNTTADFFIDGLRDDVQYFRPLYNIERVEVLKGSNALIFGRGGGGGVINRVSKQPVPDQDFAAGTVSADTFGSAYVSGDANYGLGEETAVRLNAYYEHLDNHRDFFEGDRYGFNPTFASELTQDTRVFLSYEHVADERVVDRGVPSLNGVPLEGFDQTFFGDPEANETEFSGNIARARIEHDLSGNWRADASFLYADYDKLYQNLFPIGFDAGAGTVSLDGYRDITQRQNFIFQANLIGEVTTGPLEHTLLFGVEYTDQDTENARRDIVFADSQDDQITFPFSDPLVIPAFSFPEFTRDRDSDVQVTSVYLQDQIDLGRYVKLIGGVRYDRFDIEVADFIEVADGAGDGNDGFLSRVDEEFSPRGGIIFKPLEDASIYASYSKSFLPRSGDQFLTLTLDQEALEPEAFENIELGVKWDVNDRISVTAAAFRLERDGGTTLSPDDPGDTILISSVTRGIELEIAGQILPWWQANFGYSYLDAEEDGRVVDFVEANRTLAQVPESMVSLWNRFEATEDLGFGFGVIHQSASFTTISNAVELPAFTRLDAAVYYNLTNALQLQLNVENLTNTDYFPDAHTDNNISTGAPTNARFTIRARF